MTSQGTQRKIGSVSVATVLVGLALAASAADAGVASDGIVASQFGGRFDNPVYVTSAPGAPRLMFVVQQQGIVRLVRNGEKVRKPFLDIRSRVTYTGDERGLLSIAFPSNYDRTRRFYAYFNNTKCGAGCDIEVAEFRRSRRNPKRAKPSSHRRVLRIRHRGAANHNGGTALFGPDGKLWLATGDGGGANDPFQNAQDKQSLLGKLLRINPRNPSGSRRGYSVPGDNPFVGPDGTRDEIWSIGLRNPFRFSFDPERAAIAIGDVGQSAQEEINYEHIYDTRGGNFGWPRFEGTIEHMGQPEIAGDQIEPIHTYPRGSGGRRAVTGGVVLRDQRFEGVPDADPDQGIYLFGDAFAGPLRQFEPNLATNAADNLQTLPNANLNAVGFGTDHKRRVYVADLFADRVYRLDPAP